MFPSVGFSCLGWVLQLVRVRYVAQLSVSASDCYVIARVNLDVCLFLINTESVSGLSLIHI